MSSYTKFRATIPVAAADAAFVRPIIEWMLDNTERPAQLPEHELFQHERVEYVLHNAAVEWFEFPEPPDGTQEYYRGAKTFIVDDEEGGFVLEVCGGINHEDGVIGLFHDWISVFIDEPHGHEYGWFRFEGEWVNSPLYVGLTPELVWEDYHGAWYARSCWDDSIPMHEIRKANNSMYG